MNTSTINSCLTSCDERINSVEKKLNSWKVYGKVLNLVDLDMETKYDDKIKNYEISIKLIQTEKLIYKCLLKGGNNALFPRLLEKYDDLMTSTYETTGGMVNTGLIKEGEHLEYCKESLNQREYIRKLCLFGEKR